MDLSACVFVCVCDENSYDGKDANFGSNVCETSGSATIFSTSLIFRILSGFCGSQTEKHRHKHNKQATETSICM
jgi:hypothetical protein